LQNDCYKFVTNSLTPKLFNNIGLSAMLVAGKDITDCM